MTPVFFTVKSDGKNFEDINIASIAKVNCEMKEEVVTGGDGVTIMKPEYTLIMYERSIIKLVGIQAEAFGRVYEQYRARASGEYPC